MRSPRIPRKFSSIPLPATAGGNRSFAAGRMKPGEMNRTEEEYAAILDRRMLAGEIRWWAFEMVTLKIAADTRYTPDFTVMMADNELQAHEVKGYAQEDSMVKIKVAASLFPARFFLVVKRKKADGGGFEITEVAT